MLFGAADYYFPQGQLKFSAADCCTPLSILIITFQSSSCIFTQGNGVVSSFIKQAKHGEIYDA